MNSPIVVCVIVGYGDLAGTSELANEMAVTLPWSIVVVANDEQPRPTDVRDEVEWIVPERNLGYGAAFNRAVESRTADVFVAMNVDVVPDAAVLGRAARTVYEDSTIGILSPLLVYSDGSPQATSGRISSHGSLRALPAFADELLDCDWVTGAAMFVSSRVTTDATMDGSYFLGCEDADLCLRATRSGLRVVCDGRISLIHHRSTSVGGWWAYYAARNAIWFSRANFGTIAYVWQLLIGWTRLPRIFIADVLKRHSRVSSKLHVLGLWHGMRRKPEASEGPWLAEPIPKSVGL
jgi:N-acetylglucosaminyl-diphospho-decaprenol L-rhamnosyltransferase